MRSIQQSLLALLAVFYTQVIVAQVSVSVEINGVSDEIRENVRLFLSIDQQKNHALLSEARIERLHKKAPLEINEALQPFGFYKPEINSALTRINPEQWLASYSIKPGPALKISEFNLRLNDEMKQDVAFQRLIDTLEIKQGSVFNHAVYEKLKNDIVRLADERGYFDASFIEHRVEVDLDSYDARVYLEYDGGSRYHFGEVLLKQDLIRPELLERYIPFEQGQVYTLNELIELQQSLHDTDFFRIVEVSPAKPEADSNEIPIVVKLTPNRRHLYSIGLGYGTDTGARTKIGWEIPRLNKSGHRVSSEASVSEIGYNLNMQYRVPVFNPRTDQLVYSAGIINESTDSSESTIRTFGVSLNRAVGTWRQSIGINYQQENFTIADQTGHSTLVIPSINWSRTWGNNFLNTLDGLRFDIGLRGAHEDFISDTNFFQVQSGIKAITSLGSKYRVITRGRLGTTKSDEFTDLPSSVRFFAGGGQSVRGYAYESLGPVDANGEVVGGKHLMVGSIEIERSFSEDWSVALFYDAGNAIDDLDDKLERGGGIGVRWKTPIGPVRIDIANAISRKDDGWRLHINIGPDL